MAKRFDYPSSRSKFAKKTQYHKRPNGLAGQKRLDGFKAFNACYWCICVFVLPKRHGVSVLPWQLAGAEAAKRFFLMIVLPYKLLITLA